MPLEPVLEAAPANPATGFQRWFADSTQKRLAILDEYGQKVFPPGIMGVTTTSPTSVTTAETKSIVGTVVGSFTAKANHPVVGKGLRLKARGVLTTGGTAGTITAFLKYAALTIASTGAVAPTISVGPFYWELEVDVIFRAIGASGSVMVQGNMHVQNAATPSAGVNWPIRGNSADPPAVITVDTTADSLVDFQFTTSGALHTWVSNMVTLEVLN